MKNVMTAGAALLLTTSMAQAVGLDRSGQPVGIIFEEGNYAEFSFGYVMPEVTGDAIELGALGQPSGSIGDVAEDYTQFGLGYKADLNEQWSFAIIVDEPYGADIDYPSDTPGLLQPTAAELNAIALTGLARYKIDDTFSVHGGIRAQRIDADITLPSTATTVELEDSLAFGYAIGGAYERPDIALRVALTYFSEIEHEFDATVSGVVESETKVTTPQAVNLDFQTGIAADTLLFGSVRWAEYSVVKVQPTPLPVSITDIEDGYTYTLGVGRRFSDVFSASVSATYDTEGEDDLVSPLAPKNGSYSIGLGGQYKVDDNITVSGGIRYVVIGDARPELDTPLGIDTAIAEMEDNTAIAIGFKVGYSF
ncbi:OmpP1/FadL family transporter [Roseobacter sp. CCS2]|uniref:OmpP1/FadL family transporter n=1 Tax=Roseobacter sp. CCS2 TaxID=391593 RepID=UPI0000F3E520|nr:outer membrane protein transport protein [Roseobacter sp. CCS2]EBA10998.1 membrane protein involved in aromatic hydrocarbon degradation [Roseobacter sp. CCS2]